MTEHIDNLISTFIEGVKNYNNPATINPIDNAYVLLDNARVIITDMQKFRTGLNGCKLERANLTDLLNVIQNQRDELIEANLSLTRMLEKRS